MLKEARKKHHGKILFKDVNDNKIKLYLLSLTFQRGCGRYLEMETSFIQFIEVE